MLLTQPKFPSGESALCHGFRDDYVPVNTSLFAIYNLHTVIFLLEVVVLLVGLD